MKLSTDDLLAILYRFYPRNQSADEAVYKATEEHRRLMEAVRCAGANYERWESMLARVEARFPDCPRDMSLHIQGGDQSSAYDGKLYLPTLQPTEGMHELGFHVSFIAPCYVIYSSRWFFLKDDPKGNKASPRDIRLDFDESEQPYVQGLAQEIEAAYGYERLPPEIGRVIVPDVAMYCRVAGTATIYDCLLSPDWGR